MTAYGYDRGEAGESVGWRGGSELTRSAGRPLTLNAVLVRIVDKADALEQRREQVQRHARRAAAQLPFFIHGLVQSLAREGDGHEGIVRGRRAETSQNLLAIYGSLGQW
jgi:hypothetical protein